jgi:hypothetical protein
MAPSGEFSFWGILTRLETWLGIVYLLISFPLGVFYFSLFLTWLLLGIGLTFLVVGIPILGLMFAAARALAGAERQLANWLLESHIPAPAPGAVSLLHPWKAFKALLGDPATWKGFAFLVLKFPLGILSFVLCIVLVSASIALIFTPLIYRHESMVFFHSTIDTPAAAAFCFLGGLLLGCVSLYVSAGLAAGWRALAQALLGPARTVAAQEAVRTGPIVIP